jgi:C4-dicarboxylate-specific signal transduction histidine kinase
MAADGIPIPFAGAKLKRETTPMDMETRKTGIEIVGDMPWGTHFCLFYDTKDDLLDLLTSYCKAGLEAEEFCLWVVAEPLTIGEAINALKDAVPDIDRYLAESSIEITSASDWYLEGGRFDLKRVTGRWLERLARASARGYAGVRVTGDTAWLEKKDWKDFCEYEEGLNEAVANQRLAVLCTYPLAACGAAEILDVVRTHQFAVARRHGSWEVIETAGLKLAKAEIKRLNEELEQRVVERTNQLMRASEALREAQSALAHVNRVTTMGLLVASITHEITQPVAATVTNADAALRWLGAQPPELEEARQALGRVVKDGNRVGEIVNRIRGLIKREPSRNDRLDINETILDVIALTHSEVERNDVSLQTRLTDGLPVVQGDRIRLQQVVLNLIVNAIEAMSGAGDGARELVISTGKDASSSVLVDLRDSGPGLDPEGLDRLFDAFYTTKPRGMGMGLAICRSIIEAHGGRIWATANVPHGAAFKFTLPVGENCTT